MKKLLLVLVALALVAGVSVADDQYGTIGTPANHAVTIRVTIPPRVGIRIDVAEHTKLLDLTGNGAYPPAVATYFAIGTNLISILSTGNYHYDYTTNTAGLLAGLVLGDFQYQGNGWAPPLGAGWHTFLAGDNLAPNPTARTAGWAPRNMDYQVQLDGAEMAGNNDLVVTYTMTAVP